MIRPGRPFKLASAIILPRAEQIISDITLLLDEVISRLYAHFVPSHFDILEDMRQRLSHECKRVQAVREDMKGLAESYNRFLDLRDEWLRREKRIKRIVGVLGEAEHGDMMREDKEPNYPITTVVLTPASELRKELPLWEAMKEYLQYVPEARIAEMEEFFGFFGVNMENANRQAMESALKRHPETFKIRKQKREKYISLKDHAKEGAWNAPSTTDTRK